MALQPQSVVAQVRVDQVSPVKWKFACGASTARKPAPCENQTAKHNKSPSGEIAKRWEALTFVPSTKKMSELAHGFARARRKIEHLFLVVLDAGTAGVGPAWPAERERCRARHATRQPLSALHPTTYGATMMHQRRMHFCGASGC